MKYLADLVGLSGCKAEDMKKEFVMFSLVGEEKKFLRLEIGENQIIETQLNGTDLLVARNCFLKDRVDFFIPTVFAEGFPEFQDLEKISKEEYNQLKIENRIPEFGKDYDQTYLVLELGIENTISYKAGFFLAFKQLVFFFNIR